MTSTLLESAAFARHIECYQFAQVALEKLQHIPDQQLPEVIFLDLNMPGLTGWDFLDSLTEQQNRYLGKCSIYILTSSVDKQEKELAQSYKLVSGFLRKPLDEQEIARIKISV
ncbi:response regulator [Pontibacter populi]|uniref:Response regulator n=1 Tax=Pontibacter populi TaxID=890055 RepID=A0ABV1RT30_9BACT